METSTLIMIGWIWIALCLVCVFIDIYLGIGMIFPDFNIRMEHVLRKYLFKKPAVIILDASYIRARNVKLFSRIAIPLSMLIFMLLFLVLLIER